MRLGATFSTIVVLFLSIVSAECDDGAKSKLTTLLDLSKTAKFINQESLDKHICFIVPDLQKTWLKQRLKLLISSCDFQLASEPVESINGAVFSDKAVYLALFSEENNPFILTYFGGYCYLSGDSRCFTVTVKSADQDFRSCLLNLLEVSKDKREVTFMQRDLQEMVDFKEFIGKEK